MICSHETTKKLLDGLWASLRHIQSVIDLLEDIGLSVDGCTASGKPSAASLYGAMTAADQAIQDIFGIPQGTPYHDEANMVIASARKDEREGEHFPQRLYDALSDIADTAVKKRLIERKTGDGAVPFEVTVSICGGVTVMARDIDDALDAVSRIPNNEIIETADWCSVQPTDARRQE